MTKVWVLVLFGFLILGLFFSGCVKESGIQQNNAENQSINNNQQPIGEGLNENNLNPPAFPEE